MPWIREDWATVLATLAASARPLSLSELADHSGLLVSTTFRIVERLVDAGFVKTEKVNGRRFVSIKTGVDVAAIPSAFAKNVRATPAPGVRIIDASVLRRYALRTRVTPFTVAPVGLDPPSHFPRPHVLFKHARPLEWEPLWAEDLIVALLGVNLRAARELAGRDVVDHFRLRQRIWQEQRIDEADRSGVLDIAWVSQSHIRSIRAFTERARLGHSPIAPPAPRRVRRAVAGAAQPKSQERVQPRHGTSRPPRGSRLRSRP